MKYVYTGGPYKEFRGHVFCNYKPTVILDRATEEAVARNPEFKEVYTADLVPQACPKCGRTFRRGLIMHVRFCKS